MLNKIWLFARKVATSVGGVGCLVIGFCLVAQIFCRTFLGIALSWSEEIARYLFIWQCWISVSLAERSKVHIRIFMVTKNFSQKVRLVIEILVNAMVIGINLFFIYWGIQMVLFLLDAGTTSTAVGIPMWLIYLAMPLGSFTYSLRLAGNIYRLITGQQEV